MDASGCIARRAMGRWRSLGGLGVCAGGSGGSGKCWEPRADQDLLSPPHANTAYLLLTFPSADNPDYFLPAPADVLTLFSTDFCTLHSRPRLSGARNTSSSPNFLLLISLISTDISVGESGDRSVLTSF